MLTGKDLSDYIINSDINKRRKLLKDKNIRKELFKEENHYAFIWVVQSLTSFDIDYFLDIDIIEYLKKDDRKTYSKMDSILENTYSSKFLSNENILLYLVEHFDYFKNLDINFANSLFNLILKNDKYITSLSNLNSNIQYELLTNKETINKLINLNTNINYLYLLDKKVIETLLKEPYFINMFYNTDIDIIDEYYMKKNIKLPKYLYSNKLLNKYLEIKDINKYRNYIENIPNLSFKEEVEEKRKIYYIDKFNNINNGLLPTYNTLYNKILNNEDYTNIQKENSYYLYNIENMSKDKLLDYLRELSIKEMLEITVDMYFHDITYNFLKNVYSILEYISLTNIDLIDKDNLIIYKKLINYYNLTNEERIDLFNKLNNGKDYQAIFYDDITKVKKDSYMKIKNSLLKLDNNNKIYTLTGEDFYLLVHHTTINRNKKDNINFNNKKALCTSLINHNNVNTFRDKEEDILLGFNPDINNIIHVYESDSFSEELNGSNRVQRILTKEELINRTKGYNEILIKTEDTDILPSYVVCFDEIKEGDIEFSKKYNIPIILIDSSKYKFKDKEMIDVNGDQYINSYSASFLDIDTYKKMNK